MNRRIALVNAVVLGMVACGWAAVDRAAEPAATKSPAAKPAINPAAANPAAKGAPAKPSAKVYGEWRIRVKPDKGKEYNALVEEKGLPLFKQAGGRMVGWWNTLIGDLYEHVTIWEYDDMAAFEKAVGFLGSEPKFAAFVALRDPLLDGEESRFLKSVPGAEPAVLDDPSKFVIHEIHRVAQKDLPDYLAYMTRYGLPLLKKHGFRPVGPMAVEVGQWSEITYLFRFNSLAERQRLIADFSAHPDAGVYAANVNAHASAVTTRLLMPAPFAAKAAAEATSRFVPSQLLPHVEQLAQGVWACGFDDRSKSANCGWVTRENGTLLIDVPRGVAVPEFVAEVARIAGKQPRGLALTRLDSGDESIVQALVERGVEEVIASPEVGKRLAAAWKGSKPVPLRVVAQESTLSDAACPASFIPADAVLTRGAAAVYLPRQNVLFAGPLVVNGPRCVLQGTDTEQWVSRLQSLEALRAGSVVPGFGSWGSGAIVARARRFLAEVRRQVEFAVSQGRPASSLTGEVRIPAEFLVWMPYDTPTFEDLEHVYRELSVPLAPFGTRPPNPADGKPHALVLIGDQPHEPGHVRTGLLPVFEATGVVPHFTVDVHALSAENLAKVQLLVILRDGLQRPTDDASSHYVWMTPEQQAAVEKFVTDGGAFLNLHNSMGLYPDEGPYLKLVGGRYIGHGPLERFSVEVVDATHPITRGIEGFWTADEQHTPPYDADKVHLLLRNRSDDGKTAAAAGWCYEPGKGRLCHLANGHTREALAHPTYQRLMTNAVNWLLRREGK